MMELRHMRYFVAVAEELSFTKAAQKLRLAQPSLTRQLRNLEDELGVVLLDRSKTPITLTPEGRVFLFDAKRLLTMCAESVNAVQKMQHGENSPLNIGYVANIHYGLLPATLGAFRKLCPRVALNLFDMTGAGQLDAIEARKIDLGFVGLTPSVSNEELSSACVGQDTMVVAVSEKHPFAMVTSIQIKDLSDQFFVAMSPKTHPGERSWLLDTCRKAGFECRVLQEVDTETAVIKFVADGLGIALLAEQLTRLPHDGVHFVKVAPPLRRETSIVWRTDNPSKPLRDYIEIVKDLSEGSSEFRASGVVERALPSPNAASPKTVVTAH